MEKRKGYNELSAKMEETAKNELNTRIEALSKNGKAAFQERCADDYTKLSKLGSAQRVSKLTAMIDACAKEFPARAKKGEGAKKVRGTRQDNEFLNSRKMGVIQLDKEGNFVARHDSIQAAHRAAKTADGKVISDSSICYCCNGKKGFKTAGGFRWVFEKDYNPNQPAAETAAE